MGRRHCVALLPIALLVSTSAAALEINLVGLFPNKALVQIEGGALQTLSIGQRTRDGIVLLSVERDGAAFDVQGQRLTLALGHARTYANSMASGSVTVSADASGHFVADGQVNGLPIRFVVDTGATYVTLTAAEASRLGLDYRRGGRVTMKSANGDVPAYRVKLDAVRLGDIAVHDVDAVITEGNTIPFALLGMSFLNRMTVKHEGTIMTLTKRY